VTPLPRLVARALRASVLSVMLAATCLPVAAGVPGGAQALIERMAAANPGLQSYTANLHVVVALHSMPYVSPSLDGNYYYKRPDKQAIVFRTVPVLAQQFQRIYPKMDPPATWPRLYDASTLARTPATTTLRLVPKRRGRVAYVDVVVDDATAMPSSYRWTYTDGGDVRFDQRYAQIDGNYLIEAQTGKVELPSYNADVTTTFSNFKLNVPVPDDVFSQG
jgi:outer membrane lipoprotein-sorting protein